MPVHTLCLLLVVICECGAQEADLSMFVMIWCQDTEFQMQASFRDLVLLVRFQCSLSVVPRCLKTRTGHVRHDKWVLFRYAYACRAQRPCDMATCALGPVYDLRRSQ